MNFLITGGLGFIGSYTACELRKEGHFVRIIDIRPRTLRLPGQFYWNLDVVKGSILGEKELDDAMMNVDTVIHLAAVSNQRDCRKNLPGTFETNIQGTENVLEAAIANDVKRVIFASSAAVYDSCPEGSIREHFEADVLSPSSIYGLSKLGGEILCRLYSHEIEVIILRLFNVYGFHHDYENNEIGVIQKWVTSALQYSRVTLYGSEDKTRDFIHINDVVKAIQCASHVDFESIRPKCGGAAIYNVATGLAVSLYSVIEFIRDCMKEREIKIEEIDSHSSQEIETFHSVANTNKIESDLGFVFETTLIEGIGSVVHYTDEAIKKG